MNAETLTTAFIGAQAFGVVGSLFVIARTLRMQSSQLDQQTKALEHHETALGFAAYQSILRDYSDLMWRGTIEPGLRSVWNPLPDDRRKELEELQRARAERGPSADDPLPGHGAWFAMNDEERQCYRFIRTGLELFEQAFQVNRLGWMEPDTWEKWQGTFRSWAENAYARFVVEDHRERFLPEFAALVERLARERSA